MDDPLDYENARIRISVQLPGRPNQLCMDRYVTVGHDSRLTREILAKTIEYDAARLVDAAYKETECTTTELPS